MSKATIIKEWGSLVFIIVVLLATAFALFYDSGVRPRGELLPSADDNPFSMPNCGQAK
jgi:hypothetical protein